MITLIIQCCKCGINTEIKIDNYEKSVISYVSDNDFNLLSVGGVKRLICKICKEKFLRHQKILEKDLLYKECLFFGDDCKKINIVDEDNKPDY